MKICLFDIDGTLISSGGAGKAALEASLADQFDNEHVMENLQLSGRTDRAITRDLLEFAGVGDSPEHQERVLSGYFGWLPEKLQLHSGAILPGIPELLETLSARDDVGLGLLTGNVRQGARIKLSHFGLFEYFGFGGFGDHHYERDDVAREALDAIRERHTDIDIENIWVIGDTPLDIGCARAIGAQAVAVCTGWHTRDELSAHEPDLLFDDLSDPSELLNELSS